MYEVPPRPSELGFDPAAFPYWREHQANVVERVLNSEAKLVILDAPTGAGKSAIALAIGRILAREGKKTTILTHRRQLQEQYRDAYEFEEPPYVRIATGKSNHPCILPGYETYTADQAPCSTNEDFKCQYSKPSAYGEAETILCPYYKQATLAHESAIRVLNYPMFFESRNRFKSEDTGIIICDEGHRTDKEILQVASTTLVKRDVDVLRELGVDLPKIYNISLRHNPHIWDWVEKTANLLEGEKLKYRVRGDDVPDVIQSLLRKIHAIEALRDSAAVVDRDDFRLQFKPVLSEQWADHLLLRYAPKTVLMSATILGGAAYWGGRMGVPEEDVEFISMPSTFPVESRRIFYSPVVRVNNNIWQNQDELERLVDHIDRIIAGYLPRKGLIHTANKKLAYFIRDRSKFSKLMFVGGGEVIEDFKDAKVGVLVSYSATEGVDLPDDMCRYVIFAKVPWLPKNDPVIQIQMEEIPNFYEYEAANAIVQGVGRGMRHEGDWSYSYILDSSFGMLWSKTKDLVPEWFKEALVRAEMPPLPERKVT